MSRHFDCLAWAAAVLSPIDGVVAETVVRIPDRISLNLVDDCVRTFILPSRDTQGHVESLTGNRLILEGDGFYVTLVRLRLGSLTVRVVDRISIGQKTAAIGNSSNSMISHFHIQTMSDKDLSRASALAFGFHDLEAWSDGLWVNVPSGVPPKMKRIRFRLIDDGGERTAFALYTGWDTVKLPQ